MRFSRVIRPLVLITFSKDLRRSIKGIIGSWKNIIILILFYFIVMAIWTFIGINLIGNIDDDIMFDKNLMDYNDFFKLFNLLYMLSILDFYPDM